MLTRSRRNTQAAQQAPALAPSQTASVFTVSDALLARAAELSATASSLAADLLAAEATLTSALYAAFPIPSVAHDALASRDFAAVEASLYYFLPSTGAVTPPTALDAAWKRFASLLSAWSSASALHASDEYLASPAVASVASLAAALTSALVPFASQDTVVVLSSALSEISSTAPYVFPQGVAISSSLPPDTFEVRPALGDAFTSVAPPAMLSPEQQSRYRALRTSGTSITESLYFL